jgi:hypothetical protein
LLLVVVVVATAAVAAAAAVPIIYKTMMFSTSDLQAVGSGYNLI